MKRICVLVSAVALAGCTESIADRLATARAELEESQEELEATDATCAYGPERSTDDVREEALAEWDVAAGQNVDEISPEQEWEIRKSLAAEMGLAPSEVNGWKDIYRSRAEQGKRVLARREESRKLYEDMRASQQKAACSSVAEAKRLVELHKIEVSRLEQTLREEDNSPGFLTYLGYAAGVILILFGAFMAWGLWYDKRYRQRMGMKIRGTELQIEKTQLDGLLRQAELFMAQLSHKQRESILEAHSENDLARLRKLVRESAPSHLKAHII